MHYVHGIYNTHSQIKFKTAMLTSSLYYSDSYILVKGIITVTQIATANDGANNISKKEKYFKRYYRDKPTWHNDNAIVDFADNNDSFKFREKITDQTGYNCTKNFEIMMLCVSMMLQLLLLKKMITEFIFGVWVRKKRFM